MSDQLQEVLAYVRDCKALILSRAEAGLDTSSTVTFGMICGIETRMEDALDISGAETLDSPIDSAGER